MRKAPFGGFFAYAYFAPFLGTGCFFDTRVIVFFGDLTIVMVFFDGLRIIDFILLARLVCNVYPEQLVLEE